LRVNTTLFGALFSEFLGVYLLQDRYIKNLSDK
jgi:hypothetical protein